MYEFKKAEFLWIVGVAAAVAALQVLATLNPEEVTSWRLWAISLGAGCVRAAAGAALAFLTSRSRSQD